MEGKIKIKFEPMSEDFINILLKNGYTLTIDLSEDKKELEILYYKGEN